MKMSFEAEMDGTQNAASQIVCWCITIALHQEFGVGKTRLERITARMHQLEDENNDTIMTPDANRRPSKDKARAIRKSWLEGIVESEYRVPRLRAPRGRKEQQLTIAANTAATLAWQLYAKACIDVLHFGSERLERLKAASRANYEQMNREAHEDGMDVAMEHLRRCAAAALQDGELTVEDIEESEGVKNVEREFQRQQAVFVQRVITQEAARAAAGPRLNVLAAPLDVQQTGQIARQWATAQSFQRRKLDALE